MHPIIRHVAVWTFSVLPAFSFATPSLDIVEEVRAATGAGAIGTWSLSGKVRTHEVDESFELVFDSEMRFRMSETGTLNFVDGFDGKICWTSGLGNRAHSLVLQDRDVNRLVAWAITSDWASPVAQAKRQPYGDSVFLTPSDGIVPALLSVDHNTHLPSSLKYWTVSGDEQWQFGSFRKEGKRCFPTKIVHRFGKQSEVFTIERIKKIAPNPHLFGIPKAEEEDTRYETDSASVPIK